MAKKRKRINKKFIYGIIIVLLILLFVGGIVLINNKNNKTEDKEVDNNKNNDNNIVEVDKEKPVIKYTDKLKTEVGKKIDLLDNVSVTDNSGEELKVLVEGEYDFNKVGTYELYYVAKDSGDNEAKEKFILVVEEKKNNSNNSNKENNKNEEKPIINTDKSFTTSKGFKGYVKNGITYIDGNIIANKTYSLPSSYNPGGLTKETNDAFNKMIAAAKLDGFNIRCQSGFRSYNTQNRLYNNYVNRDGKAQADIYSARPGHSEHQTGLSCDICSDDSNACINDNFNNSAEAKWASKNASKYGLILRFPESKSNETGYKYESWHFRYVGIELASKLYNNGDWITLEDYYGITSEYSE